MNKNTNICKSCENHFVGSYCNNCGEKIIHEKDFSLRSILGQAIGSVTNLDSKIFRTLKLLFFSPGSLSLKYAEGIRVPYMKPFQIFLISNLLFFIFLSEIDIFRTPSRWYFVESFDGVKVMEKINSIAETRNLSIPEIALMYDEKSSSFAKGLIIFLIPFIALISMFLTWKRKLPYGKHIIFSTHYFSFLLVFSVIWIEFVVLMDFVTNKWLLILPLTFAMLVYYIVGFKKFYQENWSWAILKGIVGVFLINIFIQLYRVSINLLTLNTL